MKNWVQPGDALTLDAPYDRVSGQGFQVGAIFAVAATNADEGETVEGWVVGVYRLAKATGQEWAVGAIAYWDDSARNVTTTDNGNLPIGVVTEAAATADETGVVRLDGALAANGAGNLPTE